MKFEDIKKYIFETAEEAGLKEYEVFYTSESSVFAETLKDEISSFSYGVSGGVGFRCIVDGKIGAASSELLDEDEMRAIVLRAVSNAQNIETDDGAVIFKGSYDYQKTNMPPFEMPNAAKIKKTALELQRKTYDVSELIADGTQSWAGAYELDMALCNSHGLYLTNKYGNYSSGVAAVVNRDGEAEESYETKTEIELDVLDELPKTAVNKAIAKLGAVKVPSGKYDVVFSAKQARALLSTFVSVFSARNAQLGLSLLGGKEGEKIASECVTVIDDPMRDGCRVQTHFDGEGVATYKKTVIENGVLKTLLYDMTSAKKAGRESTGNGQRSSYASAVSIAPYSFSLVGGEKSLEDMLVGVENGIYITELNGLHAGANSVTGDFSLDSSGFMIRNGKICEPIKGFTVAGNFFELLKNIEALSSEESFGGNSGFTSFGAPDILVRNMSIAGE